MTKRFLCIFRLLCFLLMGVFLTMALPQHKAFAKEKVLLDADMVDAFDDGVAMLMLANSPYIELVGVTTVSGNSWAQAGTAYALRQLEISGKKHIPVAMGAQYPLRADRHSNIELERKLFGIGRDVWTGSFGFTRPNTWQDFFKKHYAIKPVSAPVAQHAVDFIIDTVRKHPHELTIAAIGPCTNLAMAIRKDPSIIPLIKRVIYMGGAFFQEGNVTPAAEFNWWFDPEAARIALRAPFKEQIIVGLDVAEKIVFERQHYDRFLKTLNGNILSELLQRSHVGVSFHKDKNFTHYVWDVLVSAILIDPTIVTKEVTFFVDMNDQFGLSYGQSLAYPIHGPQGSQKARIILEVDKNLFWDMLNEDHYWENIRK